jgi:hypothetical protein
MTVRPDYEKLIPALERCEFKSLLEEIRTEAKKLATATQGELF